MPLMLGAGASVSDDFPKVGSAVFGLTTIGCGAGVVTVALFSATTATTDRDESTALALRSFALLVATSVCAATEGFTDPAE
jgi:hypothetical protein